MGSRREQVSGRDWYRRAAAGQVSLLHQNLRYDRIGLFGKMWQANRPRCPLPKLARRWLHCERDRSASDTRSRDSNTRRVSGNGGTQFMKLRQNTTIPSLSALGQGDFLHHTKKRSTKANRAQPKSFVRHYYSNTTDRISEIFHTSQNIVLLAHSSENIETKRRLHQVM